MENSIVLLDLVGWISGVTIFKQYKMYGVTYKVFTRHANRVADKWLLRYHTSSMIPSNTKVYNE